MAMDKAFNPPEHPTHAAFSNHPSTLGSVSLLEFLQDRAFDWDIPDNGILSINDIRLILSTFLRSWFSRVWCIQELSLAAKIRMFMGNTELEWREVLKFLCLLAHLGFFRPWSVWKKDKGWTTQDGKGGDGSEAWRLAEIRLRTARKREEWDVVNPILHRKDCEAPCVRNADRCKYIRSLGHMTLDSVKTPGLIWKKVSLPLLIAATWSFESKDPRDKIYAIMSLAAPLAPEDKITVDYSSPVADLYTQVAHIFIRGSGRDSMYARGGGLAGILEPLEGLSYVQDPYYSGQQAKMPGLPSWAPDFSNPLSTGRIWWRYFRAAKKFKAAFGPGEGKGNLHVLGAEIDVVEAVEPGWADIDPDDMPADLAIDVESWFQLLETVKPKNDESPIHMLFRTLTVDRLWHGCRKDTRQQSAVSFRELIAWELAYNIRKTRDGKAEEARESEQESECSIEDSNSSVEEVESSVEIKISPSAEEEGSGMASDAGPRFGTEYTDSNLHWTCDGCDRDLEAGDWHCEGCEDFDLCWECFRDGDIEHDPEHDFTLHQFSPNDESGTKAQERAGVPSRLTKALRAQSAFVSTESWALKQQAVMKSISQLRIGTSSGDHGDHGESPDSDLKDSASGYKEDDSASAGTPANNEEHGDPLDSTHIPGLKQSLLDMLVHQRSLENAAKNQGELRYLPTLDEIPAQDKLTGGGWDWCKYHGDPSGCNTLDDESSVRVHISRVYRKRCLFRTRAGRLGLGPQSVRPGDRVWLMAGSTTPYVLRKKEKSEKESRQRFGFLGEAYVHGVMYGEAAAGLTKENMVTICLE